MLLHSLGQLVHSMNGGSPLTRHSTLRSTFTCLKLWQCVDSPCTSALIAQCAHAYIQNLSRRTFTSHENVGASNSAHNCIINDDCCCRGGTGPLFAMPQRSTQQYRCQNCGGILSQTRKIPQSLQIISTKPTECIPFLEGVLQPS